MKKNTSQNTSQLKMNFEKSRNSVKVISLNRAHNTDLNNRILNRKRPNS